MTLPIIESTLNKDKISKYSSFLQKENITTNISQGKSPSTVKILCNSPFGKPSLNHSFTSDKVFDHILLHMLQSSMLTTYETTQVLLLHPP